ncbi:hypothetical protein GOV03_01905 [Candidatus Woesearchaeota archaeon]|nr:hypothetical protein [Candidatus Woesearchaeota archaeon]
MIINRTRKNILSQKENYCNNIFSQGWGLMFSRRKNLVMMFNQERKIKLHNFFVFYPIDVLVLDADKKIVEIKQNFKPFTKWNSDKKGQYVVELGTPTNYVIGDQLEFEIH